MDEVWRRNRASWGSMKEVSKWTGLVAAIWVQAFAGNSAAYANYSSTLKSVLGLTQVQLNYLALFKDLGENVGIMAGLVCNKVPPWVVLGVASLEGFLGFGSIWLVASGTISARPLWQNDPFFMLHAFVCVWCMLSSFKGTEIMALTQHRQDTHYL